MNDFFGSGSIPENYRRYLQPVIFEPWAEKLIDFVGVAPDDVVLDVAAGTGAVARAAARRAGLGGRVIASDVSPLMLENVSVGAQPVSAPIDTLTCPAEQLALPDGSVDAVLCQQGLSFMPDRVAAVREMHRVLRRGGRIALSVWASGERVDPMDVYAEVVRSEGLEPVFGRAASNEKLKMSEAELVAALEEGGFTSVEVETQQLTVRWASIDDEAEGIRGTPFGAVMCYLDERGRERFVSALQAALAGTDGGPQPRTQTAVVARAIR